MNGRRDALPFGITICYSLLLHGAFVLLIPGFPARRSPPKPDAVMVELRSRIEPAEKPLPDEVKTPIPLTPAPSPPPEPVPRPEPIPVEPPVAAPPPESTPEPPTAQSPRPSQVSNAPVRLPSAPSTQPVSQQDTGARMRSVSAPKTEPSSDQPQTPDLMPRAQDLASFRSRGASGGEAARTAEEPTVNLRDPSSRFGVYAAQIQGAVDQAWSNWREALVAAGRPGVVVVRFTLVPDGTVQEISFERRSGSPILDAEAENAIRRASLPPFPSHWTITRLHLIAQFDYLLQ